MNERDTIYRLDGDAIEPLTPSAAHDSAWQRDPGHDEMTVACRDIFERLRPDMTYTARWGSPRTYSFVGAWCEKLVCPERGPSFFVDLWVRWSVTEITDDRRKEKTTYELYGAHEIKPKIYSAGALMRQVTMQEHRMEAWKRVAPFNARGHTDFFVQPIVMHGDPLLNLYLRMSRTGALVWNGKDEISLEQKSA